MVTKKDFFVLFQVNKIYLFEVIKLEFLKRRF